MGRAAHARRRHGPTSSIRTRKGRRCVWAACSKSTTRRCNEIAAKLPGLAEAAADEAALRKRLRRARPSWIFHEQAWLPGQRATAVGTWRTNPPHLDIGCGLRHPAHALLPGPPAQRARRELVAAVVFTLVLGALYMLWFAQRFLFGAERVPHGPVADLNLREKSILAILVAAVFWLGLFPDSAMKRTELAAREYQELVAGARAPAATKLTGAVPAEAAR